MEFYKKHQKVVQRVLVNNCTDSDISHLRIKVSSASADYSPRNNSDITIRPTVNEYFYIPNADLHLNNGATIPANLLSMSTGI